MAVNKVNLSGKQYVVFKLDNELYALDVKKVESIERLAPITRVPNAKPHVLGVINLRGNVIPVLNIKLVMGIENKPLSDEARILIVEEFDSKIGFIVDGVTDIAFIDDNQVQDYGKVFNENKKTYITGIAQINDSYIMLINTEQLL